MEERGVFRKAVAKVTGHWIFSPGELGLSDRLIKHLPVNFNLVTVLKGPVGMESTL